MLEDDVDSLWRRGAGRRGETISLIVGDSS